MGKAKTSQKPEKSKGPSAQPVRLSREGMKKLMAKTTVYSPTAELADPNHAIAAMIECLIEGNIEGFGEVVKNHYDAVNITKALKDAKLSQRTFYNAFSKKGNPRLNTVAKVFHSIASEPSYRSPMAMKGK